MEPGLEIRRFVPGDADRVWWLHNVALTAVGAHLGNGAWDDDLRAIETNYLDTGGDFIVGSFAGELVAMGAIRPGVGFGEIKRMRVDPPHQGRGFGRAILERLEQRAVELGFSRLRLQTTTVQTAAQGLYRSRGWQDTGERLRQGRFDVVVFEKHLDRHEPEPG